MAKYRVQNIAGRELGVYEADDEEDAFRMLCMEGGYASPELAEHARYVNRERTTITLLEEAAE